MTGRPVRRQVITGEELKAKMAARGAPPAAADIALGLFAASRDGEFAAIDPTLERLLGRRPVSMRDVIAQKVND